jgi:3-oxoacyl-[acyl-carrier protein] reductase
MLKITGGEYTLRLKDKVAIITGGAEGIGRAYALGFIAEGASVVVSDINLPAAQELEKTITSQGGTALAVKADVAKVAEVDAMVKKAIDRFGQVDILLNNAGMYRRNTAVRAPTWQMKVEDWENVINVNLTGVFLCCRAVLPYMVKRKSGKIINVASSLAFIGVPRFTHYVASKGGVVSFTRALAREVGEFNINVNTLCPGYTLSGDLEKMSAEEKALEIPVRSLKRAEYPQDLVGTAIYLASSDSDMMTGQALVVDGGNILH